MIPDDPEQIDEETFRCGKCKRISFYTEQGNDDLCVNCTGDGIPTAEASVLADFNRRFYVGNPDAKFKVKVVPEVSESLGDRMKEKTKEIK